MSIVIVKNRRYWISSILWFEISFQIIKFSIRLLFHHWLIINSRSCFYYIKFWMFFKLFLELFMICCRIWWCEVTSSTIPKRKWEFCTFIRSWRSRAVWSKRRCKVLWYSNHFETGNKIHFWFIINWNEPLTDAKWWKFFIFRFIITFNFRIGDRNKIKTIFLNCKSHFEWMGCLIDSLLIYFTILLLLLIISLSIVPWTICTNISFSVLISWFHISIKLIYLYF